MPPFTPPPSPLLTPLFPVYLHDACSTDAVAAVPVPSVPVPVRLTHVQHHHRRHKQQCHSYAQHSLWKPNSSLLLPQIVRKNLELQFLFQLFFMLKLPPHVSDCLEQNWNSDPIKGDINWILYSNYSFGTNYKGFHSQTVPVGLQFLGVPRGSQLCSALTIAVIFFLQGVSVSMSIWRYLHL